MLARNRGPGRRGGGAADNIACAKLIFRVCMDPAVWKWHYYNAWFTYRLVHNSPSWYSIRSSYGQMHGACLNFHQNLAIRWTLTEIDKTFTQTNSRKKFLSLIVNKWCWGWLVRACVRVCVFCGSLSFEEYSRNSYNMIYTIFQFVKDIRQGFKQNLKFNHKFKEGLTILYHVRFVLSLRSRWNFVQIDLPSRWKYCKRAENGSFRIKLCRKKRLKR